MSEGVPDPLFDEQDRHLFQEAIEVWGVPAQAGMAEEEAAEFIVASHHWARGQPNSLDEVIEELADLRIMQEQLTEHIGRETIEERVHEKMSRLEERIEGAKDE